ncbi:serine protease, partial [bacterium]|nr:serine protease [bacterium]
LEGATDSKSLEDRSKLLEQLRQGKISREEFIRQDISGTRDIRKRKHGAAILLKHESRRYLITARHVLHDSLAAKFYLQQEEKALTSLPSSMRESRRSYATNKADNVIYSVIFRIPSLNEALSQLPSTRPEFMMNLGSGTYDSAPYTFSEPDYDLAIISLDQRDTKFAEELVRLGYSPISLAEIADEPSSEGSPVFTIGYPEITSIIGTFRINSTDLLWRSPFVSLPTFSFGHVAMLHDTLHYFLCDISIYPGNSGGPVIERGKLVGIISAQPVLENQRVLFAQAIKSKYIKKLLESQIKKDNK